MKKLKRIALGLVVLNGVMFSSCEELMDFGVNVDTDYTYVDFVVEPTDNIGENVFSTSVIKSSLESMLEDSEVSKDDVSSVSIKEAIIEMKNDDPAITFDYFSRVEATIQVDGLPEIVVAFVDSIPTGSRNIKCDVTNEELLGYLEGNEYMLRARGVSVMPVTDTLYIEGKLKFSVTTDIAETLQ